MFQSPALAQEGSRSIETGAFLRVVTHVLHDDAGLACFSLGKKRVLLGPPIGQDVVSGGDVLGSCQADVDFDSAYLFADTRGLGQYLPLGICDCGHASEC